MIKEYFIATILGAILGLGITGAFFALRQNNAKQNTTAISPIPTDAQMSTQISITPSISEKKSPIDIISPENDTVLFTAKTSIKGNTKPNSLIIITTPSKTFSDKSNSNGVFNISIELDSGVNLIKISSIDPDDNQDETEITLTYSSTKI
ncbi:MAG: hypothetical protein PHP97_02600 [Candidatus Shapirobacteria bacterium]|nr:hypothetical protein [Candidatus Shapirobacteria bacterium]MDD3002276.1 hypothetical protein [Candidatus Shapirobacteria bacterium]MDD4382719.1 hypothetical protein [Candidatus Shapirobacteria bacterium]